MTRPQPPADLASLTRRQIVKQFTLCTAASVIGGKLWTGRILADVTAGANVGEVKLKVGDYPGLAAAGGSVQFKFNNGSLGAYYPFTVSRDAGDVFYAVDTNCTHEDEIVGPYVSANGFMECPRHFSRFTISGQYIEGQATGNLICFPASYNSGTDILTVEIPGLLTKINTVAVQSTTASTIRLRLQSPTTSTFVYRVQYRASLLDPPVFVNFSNTAGGALNQTQFTGNGSIKTLYVDATGTAGFFSVVLIVTPYP